MDVDLATPLVSLSSVRTHMLEFLSTQRRDFYSEFDITVLGEREFNHTLSRAHFGTDYTALDKLTLTTAIHYKSNGQNTALKTNRRHKWLVALREALLSAGIRAPGGTIIEITPPGPPDDRTVPPKFEPKRLTRQASMLQNENAIFERRSTQGPEERGHVDPTNLSYGSYGLDMALDTAEEPHQSDNSFKEYESRTDIEIGRVSKR